MIDWSLVAAIARTQSFYFFGGFMIGLAKIILLFSFVVTGYAALVAFASGRSRRSDFFESANRAAMLLFILSTVLMMILVIAFISRDFSLAYVASYSNSTLPLFYTISAVWAGQSGSLLFWTWLLCIFSVLVANQNKESNQDLLPYTLGILFTVTFFFFGLMIFAENPFQQLPIPPADGNGLNPMLQNIGMVMHPPTLFIGYAGFTVPFAFAMAALLKNRSDSRWIRTTRRWTLVSWLFLSVGILLGAKWAYVELGWGGYWAWDPVENASIMPWFTATAFLHSVMIQEKRSMLKVWNLILVIITFSLTIFGTFLTRSGVMSSVHSFGNSSIGPMFLVFLFVVLFFSLLLVINRLPLLRTEHQLDSLLSRESSFIFNNLLLVALAFAVFWGTIFPLISEAVRGVTITVGPPYFNKVNMPIALALLALTGICPLIAWRKTSWQNLKKNFKFPLIGGLITAALLAILGMGSYYAVVSFSLSAFVLITLIIEFNRGARTRARIAGKGYFAALYDLTMRNKQRYGGYIVHLGILLLFVGITGSSAFEQEQIGALAPGESLKIKDYDLHYRQLIDRSNAHVKIVAAEIEISKSGKTIGMMYPSREFHRDQEPVTEVAIRQTLKEDLYLILAGWDDEETIRVKALVIPLIAWIWIGSLVLILGTLIALGPDRMRRINRGIPRLQVTGQRKEDEYV